MKIQILLLGIAVAISQVGYAAADTADMEIDADDTVYIIPKALSAEHGISAIVDDLLGQMESQAPIKNAALLERCKIFLEMLEATKQDVIGNPDLDRMDDLMHAIAFYQKDVKKILGIRFLD